MKLIIQIPCYNEARILAQTLAALPRQAPGFAQVEWLVVDDGSTDDTASVARERGVEHVVRMNGNQGLARAFMAGLQAALDLGADVILNTDADNQYHAGDIPALLAPILAGQADIVIGARPVQEIRHFSPLKRLLQGIGSGIVRRLSRTTVQDAPSGFRAFTRNAALRLNVFNSYSYTLETIIQAGNANLRIASVPVRVNPPTRPSRLMKSMGGYILRSVSAMAGAYVVYRPVRIFGLLSAVFLLPGIFLAIRYLVFMLTGSGRGHVQSVIAAGVLVLGGIFMLAIGILAHLLAMNRRLLEELRYLERSSARDQRP